MGNGASKTELQTECMQGFLAEVSDRKSLPESPVPESEWVNYGTWGPRASIYPLAVRCEQINDDSVWANVLRERVVRAARLYVGLPYKHHHIPSYDDIGQVNSEGEAIADSGVGLDCSNFTSWVYNFINGIKFTSDIHKQAVEVGRRLNPEEPLLPGDLLFIRRKDGSEISHVGIYTGSNKMIDAHGAGVSEHAITGWYKSSFAYARRVIE